ncbi:MAG: hypothetical protein KBT58_04665, partial [Bizionia sp.]|nr:hypothetical protein [Bizionia sp.]
LEISILKEKEHFVLLYSDSGSGLPPHYNFEDSESLGIQLVLILTEQLNGTMNYSNEGKSTFTIQFKPLEIKFF